MSLTLRKTFFNVVYFKKLFPPLCFLYLLSGTYCHLDHECPQLIPNVLVVSPIFIVLSHLSEKLLNLIL